MKSPTALILELRQLLADRGWTFDSTHFKESNVSWYAWKAIPQAHKASIVLYPWDLSRFQAQIKPSVEFELYQNVGIGGTRKLPTIYKVYGVDVEEVLEDPSLLDAITTHMQARFAALEADNAEKRG